MLRFLIAESETAEQRENRRADVGQSEGESFVSTLEELAPGASIERVSPGDEEIEDLDCPRLEGLDAVFLTGAPLHVYEDTAETRRQLEFMRRVLDSGTPSFGSCAGLQIACAAAGGRVRRMPHRKEVGIARRITATEAGRDHPLLAGRPPSWDALTIHFDEVEELPPGATLLARNDRSAVHACEIRHGAGVFWGVQYHPELDCGEIGAALLRQVDGLIEDGLVDSPEPVERMAGLFKALHESPGRRDVRWQLGVDEEVALRERRRRELSNFIRSLVIPTARTRGRLERVRESA